MKAMTMTLSRKRQSVFPHDWCERVGLADGGPVNAFDLGAEGLLIRPVKAPSEEEIRRLLTQTPAGKHSPKKAAEIVGRAMRKVRRT
jgi:bifunctional DNA-binding transcriptional regulator/antitoxin component of YhaV-PrlF toxin-antitoxin module